MPSLILSNPLDADDAQAIGLNIRNYAVGEIITVNDFAAVTLIRTGYAVAYGTGQDVLLTGGGPPTDATGTDGQWYLDTQAEVLWGPKTGGYWPSNPIRPDRGVAHFQIDARGHLMMTYSTGTTVDLGTIVGPANVLTAGPVTTLAAGTPAAVTIKNTGVGTQELDLSIPQGAQGVQGIQGIQGATGPTGPGFVARGAWATATAYAVNDIVTANSSTFRVKTAHTSSGSAPTAATPGANYEVWAAAGSMTDATTTAKGAIKLAGALGGTADLPTIAVAGQANGVASLDGNGKVPAAQIPAGATGSDQGNITVDVTTTPGSAIVTIGGNWGLTDTGQVYYDSAGAAAAEAAMLVPDPDGNGFSLFRPGGPWTSEDQRVATFAQDPTSRLYPVLQALAATGQRMVGNPQAGASYTLVAGDLGALVYSTAATATTITVPPNSSVPFPIGGVIEVMQAGAGQLTLAAGAGVVINSPGGSLALRIQYGRARLVKTGPDTWALAGDLSDALADQATRPMLKVRRATAFAVPTSAFTAVPWDTVDIDTAGNSYTSGSTTVTIRRSGYYWLTGAVDLSGAVAGRRYIRLTANRAGADVDLLVATGYTPGTAADNAVNTSGLAYLQSGDLLRMETWQDTGGPQNTGTASFAPTQMSAMWMRY